MKRGLSFLLAMIVVFCTLSSVTATVYADYDANLVAHQKIDNILQNYVDPNYHLDNYTFTKSEEAELRAVAKEAIVGCSTDYEKISAVTRFVAENIYYDYDYYEGRTDLVYTKPYDVWTNKRTVCDGYTRLTKALLNFINIPCMYVLGDYHAYNVAYDSGNNRWIYLDATWCSRNDYVNGVYKKGSYYSGYFDVSLENLSNVRYHEFINLKGIFVDEVEYRLITPDSKDSWANLDEWYLETRGVRNTSNVVNLDNIMVSSINNIPVICIGNYTFKDCKNLVSIKFPNFITSIGWGAFNGCTALTAITIPDHIAFIDGGAFWGCTSLKSVTIPNSVTSIETSVFENCTSLTSIRIPDSVTSIGQDAFSNCTSLSSVTIGKGVTCIEGHVFENCTNLKTITIPNNVVEIWSNVFEGCTSLTTVNLSEGLEYIGRMCFDGCINLSKINLPDSITFIGDGVFADCTSIESIVLPKGINTIDFRCFCNCSSLTSVTIPDSVTSIGSSAFYGSNVKNIFYSGNSTQWNKIEIEGYNYPINSAKIHYNATDHTSSEWIIDEKATANNEGEKHKECTQCGEILKSATIPQLKCTKPTLKKVYNANSYVKVTWDAVEGADLYRVYRKTGTGSYEYIGSTANTYFNDKEAGAGKTCRYRIKAKNEAGYSEYSASIAIKHIDEPTLKSIENSAYGVLIKWDKVTGAEKYNVYRKVSGGEYKYIGATSNTYYTDKTAESGTKYYYAIRGKRDDSISSQSASLSKYYLADPTLKTPSSTRGGVKLTWTKVTGAEGYIVYRKTGSGSYEKLKTIEGVSNLTYRDTTAKKGKKYTYKVKAYKGKTYSACSTTKSVTDKY